MSLLTIQIIIVAVGAISGAIYFHNDNPYDDPLLNIALGAFAGAFIAFLILGAFAILGGTGLAGDSPYEP